MTKPYVREEVGSVPDVNRALRRVEETFRDVNRNPLLDGLLLDAVSVGTTETTVPHGLGRVPLAVLPAIPTVNATVWQTRAADSRLLYLQASAAVSLRLYVL